LNTQINCQNELIERLNAKTLEERNNNSTEKTELRSKIDNLTTIVEERDLTITSGKDEIEKLQNNLQTKLDEQEAREEQFMKIKLAKEEEIVLMKT